MIETAAVSASKTTPNLKVYVLWPGILYGLGENSFFEYFRSAWLQSPFELPIFNEGNNYLPTIHYKDFSNLVSRIINNPPKQNYIFALDRTSKRKLKHIVQAITKDLGSGKVISQETLPTFLDKKEFKLNLKIKPTKLFNDKQSEDEDEEQFEARKYKWHSEVIV